MSGFNDLATTHPELASQWHPTLNGERTPRDVLAGSDEKPVWLCQTCEHVWAARLADRSNRGRGCPACVNQVVVPGLNDLATTNPDLAAEWHPTLNGERTPTDVFAGSNSKVTWVCAPYNHVWIAGLAARSVKGTGCPICTGRKVLEGFNDLVTTNPELIPEWHPTLNGDLAPSEVMAGSRKHVWWSCSEHGHEWRAIVSSRAQAGTGCPTCAPSGFDPGQAAILYFITNKALTARKVGITNVGKSRLARFARNGWEQLLAIESTEGDSVREVEAAIFQWLRNDIGLPQHVLPEDMPSTGGWTETFSQDGPTDAEVIARIQTEFARVRRI
jgi:hypothetical protein